MRRWRECVFPGFVHAISGLQPKGSCSLRTERQHNEPLLLLEHGDKPVTRVQLLPKLFFCLFNSIYTFWPSSEPPPATHLSSSSKGYLIWTPSILLTPCWNHPGWRNRKETLECLDSVLHEPRQACFYHVHSDILIISFWFVSVWSSGNTKSFPVTRQQPYTFKAM